MTSSRILVTGGSGFLGQHVVMRLQQEQVDTFVSRSYLYDLCYHKPCRRALHDADATGVIHLAANCGGIGLNQAKPADLLRDNLLMGINLLEGARLAGVKKYLQVGTVCMYPCNTPVPFRESDLWKGYPEPTNAPYGLAKKLLMVAGDAYRQQYEMNVVTLIPVNLYGPGDNFDLSTSHVIPALIRKCLSGDNEIVVWGDGTPTREFLYVEDCADAIVKAWQVYDGAEPINIGTGSEISIHDLVYLIARLTEFKGAIKFDPSKPNGQPRRMLDVTRAKKLLGFTATTRLEDGLEKTVEWYRKQQKYKQVLNQVLD